MKIITTAGSREPGVESKTLLDDMVRLSALDPRPSTRSGVALILTLILLSVTLVMALAFLALSNRERNASSTSTDAAVSRLAAEAALSSAEAQIAANVLSSTNPYSFGLLVSTNRDTDDSFTGLTNLFYSPRVPVWLTNLVTHTTENRFYLDLNRNGTDDPSLIVNGAVSQVGDPEWIGLLAHPDQPYGPNNPFIAEFAFIAMPVGNSLDLNSIFNEARNPDPTLTLTSDGYYRNQSVGSWELNLAAFLADLNTNQWLTYAYLQSDPTNFPNTGVAFDDARALLAFRYAGNYTNLASAFNLFGTNGVAAFTSDVDAYSYIQPPQTTPAGIIALLPGVNVPWVGADNPNHFFDLTVDLFNTNRTATIAPANNNFTTRLMNAGGSASTYDLYTFYRLLSQIGSDSAPESGKMNLNYDNLDPGFNGFLVTNGVASATNFVPWTPLNFFMNAADRMLKTYTTNWATAYVIQTNATATNLVAVLNPNFVATFNVANPFGVTSVPVWVSNRYVYTPAVQRVLQLAANLYDATSTNYYPSVFRPVFMTVTNGIFNDVFITGYNQVTSVIGTGDSQLSAPVDVASLPLGITTTNVYGVPWIIGAKKGFPNFNAFSMESIFNLTRKLQVTYVGPSGNSAAKHFLSNPNNYIFSQQLTLALTNYLMVQCWNSYRADHINAQPMVIFASNTNTVVLTNDYGPVYSYSISNTAAIVNSDWPGYGTGTVPQQSSFLIPLAAGNIMVPDLVYTFNPPPAQQFTMNPNSFFTNITASPNWGLLVTNRLQVYMLEHDPTNTFYHVIDYAQLMGPDGGHNLSADIQKLYDTQTNAYYDDQWDPNISNIAGVSISTGLGNQFTVSAGIAQLTPAIVSQYWTGQSQGVVANQIAVFRGFLGLGQTIGSAQSYNLGRLSSWQQAPYTPPGLVAYITQWSANDPLVHYLASDLTDLNNSTAAQKYAVNFASGTLSPRYQPWADYGQQGSALDPNVFNYRLKDPLVYMSDYWAFPTNRLPAVGWLGRVHRGTPWQSVYLKSSDVLSASGGLNTWMNVTGDGNPYDAANMAPVQDRLLFDLFTTAFNDNASRGTLSVNAGAGSSDPAAALASWSAVFSGIAVPTNVSGAYGVISPAGPAGVNSALGLVVSNINLARFNFRNTDGLRGVFEHKGDILSAPMLTEQSPFLAAAGLNPNTEISDEMYEWLPQQMLSLVRVGSSPRYVVNVYGRALKPAQGAVYTGSGPAFGMVTNYQVVSESAARAVLRLDTARTNLNDGTISVTPPRAVIESFQVLPPN